MGRPYKTKLKRTEGSVKGYPMPRLACLDARLPAPEMQVTRPPRLKPCDAGLVAGKYPVFCITQGNNHQLIEYF